MKFITLDVKLGKISETVTGAKSEMGTHGAFPGRRLAGSLALSSASPLARSDSIERPGWGWLASVSSFM